MLLEMLLQTVCCYASVLTQFPYSFLPLLTVGSSYSVSVFNMVCFRQYIFWSMFAMHLQAYTHLKEKRRLPNDSPFFNQVIIAWSETKMYFLLFLNIAYNSFVIIYGKMKHFIFTSSYAFLLTYPCKTLQIIIVLTVLQVLNLGFEPLRVMHLYYSLC